MNAILSQQIDLILKNEISSERKTILQPLVSFIQDKISSGATVNLNFICTHNSRRSHLCQVWAQTAAAYYGVPAVYCYSGGTETTALFPKVAETLRMTGFEIRSIFDGNNPVYAIKYNPNAVPIIGFSKKYDDPFNPSSDFAAIMTCTHAEDNCPFVRGASTRIPITYDDPKAFDQTPLQDQMYAARSQQIASEMFYVFSKIVKL